MPNPKNKWAREENLNKLLSLLQKQKELTFRKLRENLQVSDPTLSEYIEALEKQGKIEHFDKLDDRRNKWYRIKQESASEVSNQLGKYEAIHFIKGIHNPMYVFQEEENLKVAAFSTVPATINREKYEKEHKAILNKLALRLLKMFFRVKSPKSGNRIALVIMIEGKEGGKP